jgi:hypothetical protein
VYMEKLVQGFGGDLESLRAVSVTLGDTCGSDSTPSTCRSTGLGVLAIPC